MNKGPLYATVVSIAVSGTNFFAGTNDGIVWRRGLADFQTAAVHKQGSQPTKLWPNPTSERVTIINAAKVRVLNLFGVEQHIDTRVTDPDIILDVSSLPAGTYFVQTDDNSELLRLVKE
jgi:hypothetical protein